MPIHPPTPHTPATPHSRHIESIVRGVLIHHNHLLLCCALKHPATTPTTPTPPTPHPSTIKYAYLPGGHIEFGETAATALTRELLEETGLRTRAGRFLHAAENAFTTPKGKPHHELVITLELSIVPRGTSSARRQSPATARKSPTPPPAVISQEPHLAFQWVTRAQLARLELRPAHTKAWLLKHFYQLAKAQDLPASRAWTGPKAWPTLG